MSEGQITAIPQVFWSKSGLAAARPAATGLRDGSLWTSTDTKDIDQIQGGAWETILDYSAVTASVLTTRGDIIRRGAAADERLAKGVAGTVLTMGADDPAWGPGSPLTTRGDIIRRGAAADERLAKGVAGTVLTMGANDPAWVANPSPLTVAETEVFNGTAPTSWTDLDLSAVVGANYAIVLLKVKACGSGEGVAFRKNGDTDEFWHTSGSGGTLLVSTAAEDVYHGLFVPTDNAGKIEWKAQTAVAGHIIAVIAYIK